MRTIINIVCGIILSLLIISCFYEKEYLDALCFLCMLIFYNLLDVLFPDTGSFMFRVVNLKEMTEESMLYVATSDGREELLVSNQILENEQSGMITIQLEEI